MDEMKQNSFLCIQVIVTFDLLKPKQKVIFLQSEQASNDDKKLKVK